MGIIQNQKEVGLFFGLMTPLLYENNGSLGPSTYHDYHDLVDSKERQVIKPVSRIMHFPSHRLHSHPPGPKCCHGDGG